MILEKLIECAKKKGISEDELNNKYQEMYLQLLLEGTNKQYQNLTKLEPFIALLNIAPSEQVIEAVQKKYREYFMDKPIYEDTCPVQKRFSYVYELRKCTGIEVSETVIHCAYLRFVGDDKISALKKFEDVLSITPSDKIVQEAYKYCLCNSDFNKLRTIKEMSGVNVSREIVQNAYEHHFAAHQLLSVENIKRETRFKIDEDIAQAAYEEYAKTKNFFLLKKAIEITKIEPSTKVLEALITGLFGNEPEP